MILALGWVAAVAQAAPACPVSRTAEELGAALAGADEAWGSSAADFQVAVVSMRSILPCVAGAVDAPTAAHVHRIEGLVAFASRDRARTLLAFAAARAADPAWSPSDELAPPGSPLRAVWDEATAPVGTAPLPPARDGALRVDGVPAHLRPTGRPALLRCALRSSLPQTPHRPRRCSAAACAPAECWRSSFSPWSCSGLQAPGKKAARRRGRRAGERGRSRCADAALASAGVPAALSCM